MYTAFNLSLNGENDLIDNNYYVKGLEIYNHVKKCALNNLEEIIKEDVIDGDKLQNMWFPDEIFNKESFIFISHSHNDEEIAIKLAGYLYEKFEIFSFIDSCVWRHMDNLNKQLNSCTQDKDNCCSGCECSEFSHNIGYVHMMLASALMKMIDKCECMFFLNTASSINLNDKTESPWIYYELNIASIIQKISKIEMPIMESVLSFKRKIEFTPNLGEMIKIDESFLKRWESEYNLSYEDNPFVVLYKMCRGIDW